MTDFLPFVPAPECNDVQLLVVTGIYGYILFVAASMIGDGSELLLLVPAYADIVGSVVLPVLGAVPDGMMILFSGLGERMNAQSQVSVGVGALAGSTIMLLTLTWFAAMLGGRVNIGKNGQPTYHGKPKLNPPGNMSLMGTGVKVGSQIRRNSFIMCITCILYLVVQGPALFVPRSETELASEAHASKQSIFDVKAGYVNQWAGVGLFSCIICFCGYLSLQTISEESNEWMNDIRTDAIRRGEITLRGAMFGAVNTYSTMCRESRDQMLEVSEKDLVEMKSILKPFFDYYDADKNNKLSRIEFSKVFCDLRESVPIEVEDELFKSADLDHSGHIDFEEFTDLMVKYCRGENDLFGQVTHSVSMFQEAEIKGLQNGLGLSMVNLSQQDQSALKDEGENDDEEEEEEDSMPDDLKNMSPSEQQTAVKWRSLYIMGSGTLLVLIFSDPMVSVLNEIGTRTGISSFYISFVLAPLASNASELVAAYKYGSKKTQSSMTIALSTLLGAACMNNTFCLGIFYLIVYMQGLVWNFTAEIMVIVIVELLVGLIAMKEIQTMLHGGMVLALYPLSLVFVWAMNNIMNIQ